MKLPRDEWVVLAEYEPYRDVYELRILFNGDGDERVAFQSSDTVVKVSRGEELPIAQTIPAKVWDDNKFYTLFKNVYVRETYWERLQ